MSSAIETESKYLLLLDEVYKQGSRVAIVDTPNNTVQGV